MTSDEQMTDMTAKYEAIAANVGCTVEQVREVFASADGGTWTTTVNGIVSHADGSRHWGSQTCEECRS
jgi:ligand-binding sensor domain-containing protein